MPPGVDGGDRPGRKRPARPCVRHVKPLAMDRGRRGPGIFYDTKAQAVAAVRAMQARGIRSIDVGCMQVNLMHHPNAFASLEAAFDPTVNADYAGRFRPNCMARPMRGRRLPGATTRRRRSLGAEYQRKVMAIWPEEQGRRWLRGVRPCSAPGPRRLTRRRCGARRGVAHHHEGRVARSAGGAGSGAGIFIAAGRWWWHAGSRSGLARMGPQDRWG